MSYIGSTPTTAAFPFDQFSGNNSTTAFTLTYAPAGTTSILVSVSGVMQNPNTYGVIGTTLTFTGAPPTGTNNIAVLYLGLPVIGVSSPGNTAYRTPQDFTATASQTTFTTAGSYTVGFVDVYRNGARLGTADFTATNGTTVVLANACTAGDLVTIVYFTLTSIVNALPQSGGTITGNLLVNGTTTMNGAIGSGYTGFKNRIINGDMRIDQRNNGASVTPTGANVYLVDRWLTQTNLTSKYSVQQNAGAVAPPSGFTSYLGVTSLSSYSVLTGDFSGLVQRIEGLNISDLAWGTALASPIAISFWARSSLTGIFGGALRNSAVNRSYPFTFTIFAANTWEQKTVFIAGDTAGTWLSTNGIGIELLFNTGTGTTFSGTAGAWASANYVSATGAISVVGTSGATFYITGVQLERGSNATSFEFTDYGRQLAQCQRYCQVLSGVALGRAVSTQTMGGAFFTPVVFRAAPTASNASFAVSGGSAGTATGYAATIYGLEFYNSANNWTVNSSVQVSATLSSEL